MYKAQHQQMHNRLQGQLLYTRIHTDPRIHFDPAQGHVTVVQFEMLRIILATVASQGTMICQFNITSAYLHLSGDDLLPILEMFQRTSNSDLLPISEMFWRSSYSGAVPAISITAALSLHPTISPDSSSESSSKISISSRSNPETYASSAPSNSTSAPLPFECSWKWSSSHST